MHSLTKTGLWLSLASGLALAACTTTRQEAASDNAFAAPASADPGLAPRPGGVARWGTSIASIAYQYMDPTSGDGVATGASAWVPPAPPPAYVATGRAPEPDAPAPPPAAVANRQPSAQPARPAVDASQIVRPEAAGPDANQAPAPAAAPRPEAAAASEVDLAKGRELFANWSCGACHSLADANASGSIGPSLDNNPRLTIDYTRDIIHDGRGAMPAFGGQISDPDIATLAAYIVQVSRK